MKFQAKDKTIEEFKVKRGYYYSLLNELKKLRSQPVIIQTSSSLLACDINMIHQTNHFKYVQTFAKTINS